MASIADHLAAKTRNEWARKDFDKSNKRMLTLGPRVCRRVVSTIAKQEREVSIKNK